MWQDKPYAEGQAWIDLLLLAAYEAHDVRGETWEPGTVHLSNQYLMKRWGWTRYRLEKTLASWEQQEMISRGGGNSFQQTFRQGFQQGVLSPITIVKWGFFQGSKPKVQQTFQQTFQQQQKNIYKKGDECGAKSPRPRARKKPPVGGEVKLVKNDKGEWVAVKK